MIQHTTKDGDAREEEALTYLKDISTRGGEWVGACHGDKDDIMKGIDLTQMVDGVPQGFQVKPFRGVNNTVDPGMEDKIDPETALKAGINNFMCKKNDFGIVSIAGEFVNGIGFINDAKNTIGITDQNENVITSDSNNFHNVEKYDTRKFVAYIKTDEKFYDCTVEITSNDGLLNYKTSLFLN